MPSTQGHYNFQGPKMIFLDYINNSFFLKRIFPEGLVGIILIGQVRFDVEGRFSINLHTMQKPSIEIAKWGIHGQDYDVIVIKLFGSNATDVSIKNWRNISYAHFFVTQEDGRLNLRASERDWAFSAVVETRTRTKRATARRNALHLRRAAPAAATAQRTCQPVRLRRQHPRTPSDAHAPLTILVTDHEFSATHPPRPSQQPAGARCFAAQTHERRR